MWCAASPATEMFVDGTCSLREIGSMCPFGGFPLSFAVFFGSNLEMPLENVVFLRSESPKVGPAKDGWHLGVQKIPSLRFFPPLIVVWTHNLVVKVAEFDKSNDYTNAEKRQIDPLSQGHLWPLPQSRKHK